MTVRESLEDLLYAWVRRNAPKVTREALDELIDGVTDRIDDHRAEIFPSTRSGREFTAPSSEVLRGWASLD